MKPQTLTVLIILFSSVLSYAQDFKIYKTFNTGNISYANITPNDSIVICGMKNGDIKGYDLHTTKELYFLHRQTHHITSINYNTKGDMFISSSLDKSAIVWRCSDGKQIRTYNKLGSNVWAAEFTPDGKYVVFAYENSKIKVIKIVTKQTYRTLRGHKGSVFDIAVSPDGKYIASSSRDQTIKIWDYHKGILLRTLKGHSYEVNALEISPDGTKIASVSKDNTIRIWDFETGKQLRVLRGHLWYILTICFSPDGKYLATGAWDKTVRIWNVESGEMINTLSKHGSPVNSVRFSRSGKYLITSDDAKAIVWETGLGINDSANKND